MIRRCIAVDSAEFARDYWGNAPLLSRSAELPRDFRDLLSPEAVDELIAERGVRTPFVRMARNGTLLDREFFTGSGGFGAEMPDQVDSAKIFAEFAGGATIVLQGLHRLWPPIIDFVRDLVDEVGHPTQANAYVTPPSNRGFDPHYDVHDVFVLQVSGRKHWTVHDPVHRDPLPDQPWTRYRAEIEARVRQSPAVDTVLEAGDALYLPRGWVHSATALGGTSIHLTIGVAPFTRYDVARRIAARLAENPEVRASLPFGLDFTASNEVRTQVESTLDLIRAELLDASPAATDAVTEALGRRFVEQTRPVAIRPLHTLETLEIIDASTTVQWRHGLAGSVHNEHDKVRLRLPDKTIAFPGECAEALEAIRTGERLTAAKIPGLSEADALVVIRRLIREAVVVAEA